MVWQEHSGARQGVEGADVCDYQGTGFLTGSGMVKGRKAAGLRCLADGCRALRITASVLGSVGIGYRCAGPPTLAAIGLAGQSHDW